MPRHLPAGSTLMDSSKASLMPALGSVNSTSSPPSKSNNVVYKFNIGMEVTIIIVIAAFLSMSIFLFYVMIRKRWSLDRRIASSRQQQQEAATGHPNPNGLDNALVEKFPLVRYGSAKRAAANAGKLGYTDCSVCLTEFEDDEKLRILPNCGHGFHADCIDMWLLSHSTCPLCRINLIPSSPDQISITAAHPLSQAQPEDIVADSLSNDDLRSLSERRGSDRLAERLTVRALSRNSESFRKAAQDAELICAGEVERDECTFSRRWKMLRANWASESHQQSSTSNRGGQDDPHLLSDMNTGEEISADDSIQQSENREPASDRWGSACSSHASTAASSAAKSDSSRFTHEVAQQRGKNAETGWVSVEIDATTEEYSQQLSSQHEQSQAAAQI